MSTEPSIADWAQVAASVFAGGAFLAAVYQLWQSRLAQEKADKDSLEAKQIEIYQRLEIESNVVFQFEAANKAVLPAFKTHLAPAGGPLHGDDDDRAEARLIARKYYEICCNLFEIAARLKRRGYVEPEVFGSWVAWYFDTVCEWGFRAIWADLRDNYTTDLRTTFDPFVKKLIETWDMDQETLQAADLCKSPETVEALRTEFYERVGHEFKCDWISGWISEARTGDIPRHPRAFR